MRFWGMGEPRARAHSQPDFPPESRTSFYAYSRSLREEMTLTTTGVFPAEQCSSEWVDSYHPSRHWGKVSVQTHHHLGLCFKLASHVNCVPGWPTLWVLGWLMCAAYSSWRVLTEPLSSLDLPNFHLSHRNNWSSLQGIKPACSVWFLAPGAHLSVASMYTKLLVLLFFVRS